MSHKKTLMSLAAVFHPYTLSLNQEYGEYTIKIRNGNKNAAKLNYFLDKNDGEIFLSEGRTYAGYDKRGIGTKLRALVLYAAYLNGFKKAVQISTNLNKMTPGQRPISARIMNKLGFKVNKIHNNKSENRSLNLNKSSMNKILAILKPA